MIREEAKPPTDQYCKYLNYIINEGQIPAPGFGGTLERGFREQLGEKGRKASTAGAREGL